MSSWMLGGGSMLDGAPSTDVVPPGDPPAGIRVRPDVQDTTHVIEAGTVVTRR